MRNTRERIRIWDQYAVSHRMPASVPALFARWVQPPPAGRILDIGCGDGRFLEFCQAVAADSPAVGVELSWTRALRVSGKGFRVVQAEGERLPFSDGVFHLVLLMEVIEHTVHGDLLLAEVARVLCPTGRLILTTPNYPAKRLYDWLAYLRGARRSPADDPTHVSPYSARRIRRLCLEHFRSVESHVSRLAGEGRWPVLAHLRSLPMAADLLGHKVAIICEQPRQ